MTYRNHPSSRFSDGVSASTQENWIANLDIELGNKRGVTRMTHSLHRGPLRVQKVFQETDGSCHVYLLHPPGGVVAGDQLGIRISTGPQSHGVITTPAAGKFYRVLSGKSPQIQKNFLKVAEDSLLEWLPQETIFFRGVNAVVETHVEVEANAQYIGWEINCLGRRASGEVFDEGCLVQEMTLSSEGKLLHRERNKIQASQDDPLRQRRWGLASQDVFGTLIALLPFETIRVDRYAEQSLEDRLMLLLGRNGAAPYWGVTIKTGILLVRYLGGSSQECREGYMSVRNYLLKTLRQIDAVSPRIWLT